MSSQFFDHQPGTLVGEENDMHDIHQENPGDML
jgi:hypothetical protein